MKPGTLFALNRQLCARQTREPGYRFVPLLTALKPDADSWLNHDSGLPSIRPHQPPDPAAKRSRAGRVQRVLIGAGLLMALIAANACLFGFEQVSRARERRQLGRALAAREFATQQLLLANRQLVSALAMQAAALQTPASPEATFVSARLPAAPAAASHSKLAAHAMQGAPATAMRVAGQTEPGLRLVTTPLPATRLTSATHSGRAGDPQT